MIRPFGLQDAPRVRSLQTRGALFDLRRHLLGSPDPTYAAMAGLVSGYRIGARTLVSATADGLDAFVQAFPDECGVGWEVTHISPALDQDERASALWQDLLGAAVSAAAAQRIPRLCARVPQEDAVVQTLRRCGFAMLGCEEVFVCHGRHAEAPLPAGLRPVQEQDAFALGQFRRRVMPPLLYQARWSGMEEACLSGPDAARGMVWVEEGTIVAHLTLQSARRGHWLECTVLPERRGDLLPYLRYVLYLADRAGAVPVYAVVPDYTAGVAWLLRMLGFESIARQEVLVAHTVSRVTVNRPAMVSAIERGADAVIH
ncbi:MAG: hypothetical protein ACOX2L_08285 [Anaerolineae bacterium]